MNNSQNEVLDSVLRSRAHTFVSGEAGTGKSVVLREYVKSTDEKVVVCAPTGLAATHVDGVTIHSLFRFPVLDDFIQFQPMPNEDADKVLASIDAVVIDEASMVRCDMFDAIDKKLRQAREVDEPFGGVRMVLFGDLLQLPPVTNREINVRLDEHYEGLYFFDAKVSGETEYVSHELTEVMRQSDVKFVGALKRARMGAIAEADLALINQRVVKIANEPPTPVLALTNEVVNNHNKRGLAKLDGEPFTFHCEWRAEHDAKAPIERPCEKVIELKVGCPVLFTRNDEELGVSNGTRGTVTALDHSSITVRCGKREIEVEQAEWPVYEYAFDPDTDRVKKQEIGQFLQLPLRLGFAMTVHRSQGQTYDRTTVDFANSRPFSPGQGYVAISRVRSLDGLTLTRKLRKTDFRHSPRAADFLARTLSAATGTGSGGRQREPAESVTTGMLVPVPASESMVKGFIERGFACPACGEALQVWQSRPSGPNSRSKRWAVCANDCHVSHTEFQPKCFMVN
ncbi:MAG: ATP-dependent DNA helicase, partial [Solirubrobacterales bacterium]